MILVSGETKKGHTANPKNKHNHAPYYAHEITKGEDRDKQIVLRVKYHSKYLTHTPPTCVHNIRTPIK